MAKAKPLAEYLIRPGGKAGPGRGKKTGVNNTSLMRGSTNAAYLAARIKRDRPDIAEAVERSASAQNGRHFARIFRTS